MPADMEIDINGLLEAALRNKKRSKNINTRSLNAAGVATIEGWVKKNFNAEGGMHEDGNLKWKILSQKTIDKRRKGKGIGEPKILQDTGNLKNRWERYSTSEFGRLRSAQNYSSDHEYGIPSRNLPQRKIFPEKKQAEKLIKPALESWLRKNVIDI